MDRTMLAIVLCAVLGAAAGFALGSRWMPHADQPAPVAADAAVGDRLPSISLPDIDGRQHGLDEWRGRPLLINFFATWCEPCIREMPLLEAAAADSHLSLAVVGVAQDDSEAVKAYLGRVGVHYPILLDLPASGLSRRLGDHRDVIPFSVLVDAQGMVRGARAGSFADAASLQQWLSESIPD
jgi:thiol-disulfide isomerase/thioredoxin